MSNLIEEKINIPASIYIDYLPDDLINDLKEYCYKDLNANNSKHISEGKAKAGFLKYTKLTGDEPFHMSRNLLLDDTPNSAVIRLEKFIVQHIKQILDQSYPKITNNYINVDGISFTYYAVGGSIDRHCHFPSTFVSSIYLDVDKNSSPITFSGGYDIEVENNKCITHHGITEHEVEQTFSSRLMMICDTEVIIDDELSKRYYE